MIEKRKICLRCSFITYLVSVACAMLVPIFYIFIEHPIEGPLLIMTSMLLPLFDSYRSKEIVEEAVAEVSGVKYIISVLIITVILITFYKDKLQVLVGKEVCFIALGVALVLATNLFCFRIIRQKGR
ncbi:hypothetical protein [Vreelandella sp. EE27]